MGLRSINFVTPLIGAGGGLLGKSSEALNARREKAGPVPAGMRPPWGFWPLDCSGMTVGGRCWATAFCANLLGKQRGVFKLLPALCEGDLAGKESGCGGSRSSTRRGEDVGGQNIQHCSEGGQYTGRGERMHRVQAYIAVSYQGPFQSAAQCGHFCLSSWRLLGSGMRVSVWDT